MELGIIGLGKMGGGIARRLHAAGHDPVGYDLNEDERAELASADIRTADSLDALAAASARPACSG
jgi:6-phosphogluconate dehydrogenase